MLNHSYLETPVGLIQIQANEVAVTSILFVEEAEDDVEESTLTKNAVVQLTEYFDKKRKSFSIPLVIDGTAFQQSVWEQVKKVSFGSTATYLQISKLLNNEGGVRAVGTANGKNRFAIVIPCHRVIATSGGLTGYAWGLWRKEWLLYHEGILTQTKLFD
jgi:methylated-DNA-[protein]-cysteine S-methyltransferase